MGERKLVGTVNHYFGRISVAGIVLSDRLAIGDQILVIGHTTALEQTVTSMEMEHRPIEVGEKGQAVGIKVIDRVRMGDEVYIIIE